MGEAGEASLGLYISTKQSKESIADITDGHGRLPFASGLLSCGPLSTDVGPGMGDGIHCCGLYGWMALAGVDGLYEFELYDTAETGVLELCEKPPSDVNNGLSLWRRRDPSRMSLMVTISSGPLVDVYLVPWSTSARAGCVLVPGRCWLVSYVGNPAHE